MLPLCFVFAGKDKGDICGRVLWLFEEVCSVQF